jgi:hypothetical protein
VSCICDVTLTEIVHSGADIGADWSYRVTVGETTISLDGQGHGAPRERIEFDPPPSWKVEGGSCGDIMSVQIRVQAEEEDLFQNDLGERTRVITVACPESEEGPNRFLGQQLVARVVEEPSFLEKVHWVAFIFDLETRCSRR